MNRLSIEKRAAILELMVEGTSIRAITRIQDVSKTTVTKLLVQAGTAFDAYQDRMFRELPCKRIQVDEIWSFVYAKDGVQTVSRKPSGDVWTWLALCPDTKIVPSYYLGKRNTKAAKIFLSDLASRMAGRIQLTSDGLLSYVEGVEHAFGDDVDFARTVKAIDANGRISTVKQVVTGNPDPRHISTSLIERQNLNLRMGNRRFTRKTNAFSKKVENHQHALAIYLMYYNFVRIHSTLRVTPAMAAGVAEKLLTIKDIVILAENG